MLSGDWSKSYGQLSEILARFGRFYHDLSLIILKSCDLGCQFWNFFFYFTKFHMIIKLRKSLSLKELAQKLCEVWQKNWWEGVSKDPPVPNRVKKKKHHWNHILKLPVMSQSIPTGYIPPGKFFWWSKSWPPKQFLCLIPCPRAKKWSSNSQGLGQNFPKSKKLFLKLAKNPLKIKKTMRQYKYLAISWNRPRRIIQGFLILKMKCTKMDDRGMIMF